MGDPEGVPVPLDGDAHAKRPEAVPEALVDPALGRPQDRKRLAAVAHLVALRPHHPTQDPLAPMGCVHANERHSRGRQHASGHGELEAESTGGADDAVAVIRGDGAIGLGHRLDDLPVLVAQPSAERGLAGLVEASRVTGERSDLDFHGRRLWRDACSMLPPKCSRYPMTTSTVTARPSSACSSWR